LPPYETVARELAEIVGDTYVSTDPDALAWVSRDALDVYRSFGRPPEAGPVLALVRPKDAAETAAVLAWASRWGVAVVPRGGGTGVMGAAIPVRPAVVLDLGRLDDVVVHAADMRLEAGAGATLYSVARAAEEEGLLFAHDPWSVRMATVGGAISTNGMGYLAGPYGKMGEQVLALEVALADGTVIATRPTLSGGPGPLVHRLFAGAEGVFGVITRAWLRAWPLPEVRLFGSFRFSTFAAGFRAVAALFRLGVVPSMMDMTDSPPLPEEAGDELAAGAPHRAGREVTVLHLGFFGFHEGVQAAWSRAMREMADRGGDFLGPEPAEGYWQHRYDIADRYRTEVHEPRDWRLRPVHHRGFEYINVELPASQVLPYRERCLQLINGFPELLAGETGLWGRPEIFSVVIHDVAGGQEGARAMQAASDRLVQLAQDYGGTMEAIHGPGAKLQPFLRREWGGAYGVIRAIKGALDPAGVLHAERWA